MTQKQLVILWIMGIIMCLEYIAILKYFRSDVHAFLICSALLGCLSLLRDREGKNIYGILRKAIKG